MLILNPPFLMRTGAVLMMTWREPMAFIVKESIQGNVISTAGLAVVYLLLGNKVNITEKKPWCFGAL